MTNAMYSNKELASHAITNLIQLKSIVSDKILNPENPNNSVTIEGIEESFSKIISTLEKISD